jgi:hypothetical protein
MSDGMYQTTLLSVESPFAGPPDVLQPAKAIMIIDKNSGVMRSDFGKFFIVFMENRWPVLNHLVTKLRVFLVWALILADF